MPKTKTTIFWEDIPVRGVERLMKISMHQIVINMASALIMFIGGMIIVFYFPGAMKPSMRVLIGVFVSIYFLLRMGQSYLALKQRKRSQLREAEYVNDEDGQQDKGTKSS